MLKIDYPNFELNNFENLNFKIAEPKIKINIRGKNKDFFTKVGKILCIMLPVEPNTSTSNNNLDALWLSPDEWMIYLNENIFDNLFNEISKLNLGSVTDVSDQWICINIRGNKVFDLLSAGSPFDFREFKNNKNNVTQTLLNHINVTVHHKELNEINLFVRRSFSEHLMSWLNDSARFI
tara:strand:+ start:970 stop:1506 length:537 start_codon:yes stop_codon:yes gene_type:complete